MKIQIPLSATAAADDSKKESDTVPAPSQAGTNYSQWQDAMKKKPNFKEIKRLDGNKMVALDAGGNTIETFVIETKRGNIDVDTLDAKQTGTPIDKTENDVRVDPKLEKGA